jgi:glycosyltransferase involved in cell wall biosynthesis
MNTNPLVSVIMIFFNGEKFIEEAIESVLSQTYPNWELLLVDDGSTDSSNEIVHRYVNQLPRKIRYLEHENHQNRGMSATRNLGIRNAQGEYIALLDCDDVWLSHKLEQQVEIMESQPEASMVYGPSQKWYSWTGESDDIQQDVLYNLGVQPNTLLKPPILLNLYLQGKAITPCPSNILFRRELIQRVGGFEESWRGIYQLYEDQVFFTKVYLKETVFVASECWDKYRKHPDSCVSAVRKAGQADTVRLFFLNWQEKYLLEQGVTDANIWKSLQKAIWAYQNPWLNRFKQRILGLIQTILRKNQ